MVELIAVFLTLGAVLYHTFGSSIGTIVFVGCMTMLFFALMVRSVRGVVFGCCIGAVVILGGLNLWRVDTPTPRELFGNRAFEATVVSVDRRLDRTLIVVREMEYAQKVQISMSGSNSLLPGDMIAVRGTVVAPRDFVTDSGHIFGYEAYLGSKGIVALVNNAVISDIRTGEFSLTRFATTVRYRVADIFSTYVSFPFDGVLAGMIVGYQGGLPSSIQDLFRDTGVLHVLVLSGYNITLLAGFLAIVFKGLSFRARSIVTVIAIVILVLVSGAGVAAVRAGIMGSIAVFAGLAVRTYQPMRALAIAYVFFFFISPTAIFVDPGFHLSFLATLFMIVVLPKIETLFSFIPKTDHLDVREIVMLACTVPIWMLPYMMYFSGTFPLVSPFANILFAVLTPVVMVAGIALVALSWLTPMASFLGTSIGALGVGILAVLEWCAKLPIWQTPSLAWWGLLGIYGGVLWILFQKEIILYLVQLRNTFRTHSS